jgi:uncharacterized protein (TIGR03086 family)
VGTQLECVGFARVVAEGIEALERPQPIASIDRVRDRDEPTVLVTSGVHRPIVTLHVTPTGCAPATGRAKQEERAMQPVDQLSVIIPAICGVVDRIPFTKLPDPTPCARFTVHDVLNHMLVLGGTFTDVFRGVEPTPITPPFVYGWVPASEFRATMTGLLDAVSASGALEQTVQSPMGPMQGETFARFVALDGALHGWDLAVATHRPYSLPDQVVAEVERFARQVLTSDMRGDDTFAAEVEPAADSTPLERLAAFSGRRR